MSGGVDTDRSVWRATKTAPADVRRVFSGVCKVIKSTAVYAVCGFQTGPHGDRLSLSSRKAQRYCSTETSAVKNRKSVLLKQWTGNTKRHGFRSGGGSASCRIIASKGAQHAGRAVVKVPKRALNTYYYIAKALFGGESRNAGGNTNPRWEGDGCTCYMLPRKRSGT